MFLFMTRPAALLSQEITFAWMFFLAFGLNYGSSSRSSSSVVGQYGSVVGQKQVSLEVVVDWQ